MPNFQEICGIDIHWLEPGEVCEESLLGLTHPTARNTVAVFHGRGGEEVDSDVYRKLKEPVPRSLFRVDKAELLRGLHAYTGYGVPSVEDGKQVFYVDYRYSPADPPVELLEPVTVFAFNLPDDRQSWLAYLIGVDGLEGVVSRALGELSNIGYYLWHRGQVTDDDRWGVRVSFHTLWTIQIGAGEDPNVDWWLEGYIDPAAVKETKLPPQTKPERGSTLAHRIFL